MPKSVTLGLLASSDKSDRMLDDRAQTMVPTYQDLIVSEPVTVDWFQPMCAWILRLSFSPESCFVFVGVGDLIAPPCDGIRPERDPGPTVPTRGDVICDDVRLIAVVSDAPFLNT